MNDNHLLKTSLICSLIGIFILIIISQNIELNKSNIISITKEDIDNYVRIKGEITTLTETPGLYILNVKDNTGEITTIVFKEKELNLIKGSLVEIEGKVTEYKNILEINAEIIKLY